HLLTGHGQAHKAKPELLLNFRKYRFHIHVSFSFCCGDGLSSDNCSRRIAADNACTALHTRYTIGYSSVSAVLDNVVNFPFAN
ncbi:MAG: hypothetical protein PUD70_06710, partial [Firmicutes bacterium]|nr:hypothetical protein [Bacillota bacterium]